MKSKPTKKPKKVVKTWILVNRMKVPICKDCGQPMLPISMVCIDHGGRLWQCPEDKTVDLF